jgi:hypothetical protein
MPGRNRWKDRDLIFQSSGVNIQYILDKFPEAEWDDSIVQLRDEYIVLKQQEDNNRAEKEAIIELDSKADGYKYRTKPYDHQRRAFMLSRNKKVFGLFMEQGTGKTKVGIDTSAYLYERGEIDTLIVIAPNGVHINWTLNEVPAHMPTRIPLWMDYYSAHHAKRRLQSLWDAATEERGELRIITFNVEGFTSEKARELLEHWLEHTRPLVIVDESSRIGDYHAKRTKYLIKVMEGIEWKRIMTGTPVTRGLENLFSQFKFLDARIIGHNSYTTFKTEYCIEGKFKNVIGYRNVEKISDITAAWSYRVLKEECLDLPAKIYRRLPFDMAPFQRKLYDAYRKDAMEEVKELLRISPDVEKPMEIALVKALRLHQIACGLSPDENRVRLEGPNPRMEAVLNDIEDARGAGKKYIVWCRFTNDLEELIKKLGKKVVSIYGKTPKDQRMSIVNRFQNEEGIDGLIGHVKAAGIGYTLTAATRVIYHSNLSDLELRLQSEDRAHRIGTTEHVTYSDVEAIRSIDQIIIRALRTKKKLADEILKDPLSLFMEESA